MTGLPAKRKADDESAPNVTTTSTKTRRHDPAYLTWSDGADENIKGQNVRWEICQTKKTNSQQGCCQDQVVSASSQIFGLKFSLTAGRSLKC